MTYKAVGFDYGGVIGGVNSAGSDFIGDVAQALALPRDELAESFLTLNSRINCGELRTWREFWQIFLKKHDRLDALEDIAAMSDDFAKRLNVVDASTIRLIDKLRVSGIKAGLLSNTSLERAEEMRALGINKHFDSFLVSAEIGMMKPSPGAFKRLAQELQVELDELAFVDDSQHSLSTAADCGYKPILFKNYEQLVHDLKHLNITVL